MGEPDEWIGTEEAGRRVGMSDEWIRRQFHAGRLPGRLWAVGNRTTIRIRSADLAEFVRRYSREIGARPSGRRTTR
jgi:hypothetical protein